MGKAKHGYKTTEFWLSLAAVIVGAVMSAGFFAPDSVAAKIVGVVGVTLTAMGYTAVRGFAKRGG